MADGPKTASVGLNGLLDTIIDMLQASKNLVVSVGSGGVDLAQGAVEGANKKIDEAIDELQKLKG